MIELINIKEGEIFDHSIVYLFGICINYSKPTIEIIDSIGNSITWSINNNYFKVNLI
jgi:hypothetical protein